MIGFIGGSTFTNGVYLKSCRQVDSLQPGDCNTTEHPRWEYFDDYHGTDNYGFSGLPGGSREPDGAFNNIGYIGAWWSSTPDTQEDAYPMSLYNGSCMTDLFFSFS